MLKISFSSEERKLANQGFEALKNREFKKGIEFLKKSVEINPEYDEAWHGLGYAYLGLQDTGNAISSLENALILKPNNDTYLSSMGKAYSMMSFQRFEQKDFDNWKSLAEKSVEYHEKSIKNNPNNIISLLDLGTIYYRPLNQFKKSIECLNKVIKINPNEVKAWMFLGFNYREISDLEKAINSFEKVIELNPNFERDARINLGDIYKEKGDFKTPLKHYQIAKKIDPNNQVVDQKIKELNMLEKKPEQRFLDLGFKAYQKGDWKRAISELNRVLKDNPLDSNALKILGECYNKPTINEFEKSNSCVEKSISILLEEKNPNLGEIFLLYLIMADNYKELNDKKKISIMIEKAKKIYPKYIDNNFLLFHLTRRLLISLEDHEAAAEALEKILIKKIKDEITEKATRILLDISFKFFEEKKYEQAIKYSKLIFDNNSIREIQLDALLIQGKSYLALGNKKEAQAVGMMRMFIKMDRLPF